MATIRRGTFMYARCGCVGMPNASVNCYHRGLACEVTIKYTLEDGVPVSERKLDAHVLKKIGSLGPKREGHGVILHAMCNDASMNWE